MYKPTLLLPFKSRVSEFISTLLLSVYSPIPLSPTFISPFTVTADLSANTPTPLVLLDISITELLPRRTVESVINTVGSRLPAYIP